MKQRFLIYLFLFILAGALGYIGWSFFSESELIDKESPPVIRRSEPAFRQDGVLYFIDNPDLDTLSRLKIEIAKEYDAISRGLMNRSHLNSDKGMLFIFDEEEELSFWMKNTRISLDIIFVNNNLHIVQIAEHTLPYSEDPIPSIYPARYVVEINAGYCRKHQINTGDLIQFYKNDELISLLNKRSK